MIKPAPSPPPAQPNERRARYPELVGRLAVVTGAAGGIGLATVYALRAAGVRVLAVDIATPRCIDVSSGHPDCVWLEADVGSAEGWARVVAAVEARDVRLDMVINGAGVFPADGLDDVTEDRMMQCFRINQAAPVLGASALRALLERSGRASIVVINSIAGMLGTGRLVYTSSKWGLRGASRGLARELAPTIRVNSIFPGLIDTPMARDNPPGVIDTIVGMTPLGRIGQPEEIAAAALFLCSDDALYVTGAELAIDGGFTS